jgi:hypothetical protein
VTEKHDAAHDTRGRHPENGLGLHYSRFSPISADRLLFPQLLAGSKIGNPAANRPSQVSRSAISMTFRLLARTCEIAVSVYMYRLTFGARGEDDGTCTRNLLTTNQSLSVELRPPPHYEVLLGSPDPSGTFRKSRSWLP